MNTALNLALALSFCLYGLSAIASSDLGAFNAAFLLSEKFNKEADLEIRFLKLAVENTTYLPYRQAQTLLGERLGQEEGERHLVAAAKGMCPRAMFSLASGVQELSNASLGELGLLKLKDDYRRVLLQRCARWENEESMPCQIYLLKFYLQDYGPLAMKVFAAAMIVLFVLSLVVRYF